MKLIGHICEHQNMKADEEKPFPEGPLVDDSIVIELFNPDAYLFMI